MAWIYTITFIMALGMVGACLAVDRRRSPCLLLLTVSIAVCDLGHLLLARSGSLAMALHANRLAYLGQVFLPMLILLMILRLCGVRYPKRLAVALAAVGVAVLAVVMSPGITTWYYQTVDITVADGATMLVRTYGPLQNLYPAYLLGYMIACPAIILYALGKGRVCNREHAWLLLTAVLGNVIIWVIEAFLPRGFEFLTISYVVTEAFILVVYNMLQELAELRVAALEEPQRELVTTFTDEHIDRVFAAHPCVSGFSRRERELLRHLLADRPRREIAEAMSLSESSVKKYTAAVFRKLEVKDRKELFSRLAEYL